MTDRWRPRRTTTRTAGAVATATAGATAIVSLVVALGGSSSFGQQDLTRYVIRVDAVRDVDTHLVWQRAAPAAGLSFAAAARYCADLVLDGAEDWRVPSMQELQTLVDEGRVNPAIDPVAFPDTPAEGFWSGTPWGGTIQLAWHVDFDRGGGAYDTATMEYRVRCVRWDGP